MLGYGTGKMLSILKEYGHVKGKDFSEDAIKFSLKHGLANVKTEDLNTDVLYHYGIKND